jgi:hypothetical protein
MWMTRSRSVVVGALLAIAATLGAGTAQAAVYRGSWDPTYGPAFPDLGWKATATFDVPATCLGQADGSYGPTGACAGFSVLSAEVDFYNSTVDANPDTSPVLESFFLNTNVIINGIDITGGKLTGLETGFFDSFIPSGGSLSIAGNGLYSFSLVLFDGNKAQLIYARPTTASPTCANPFTPVGGATCGVSATAATGVFAPVPEPGTYALVLAGLGVLGFTVRRRRRQ